jgi:LysR substrate binding domain-containing protein
MVAVCSPRHRLARARHVTPTALAGERWIAFPPRPGPGPEPYSTRLEHRLTACGLGGAEVLHIDSLTAQKRMVEAGFGLALLSESSVDEELRSGSLRPLPVAAMRTTIPIVLIHRRRAYLSGAARALATMLTAWVPVDPRRRPASAVADGLGPVLRQQLQALPAGRHLAVRAPEADGVEAGRGLRCYWPTTRPTRSASSSTPTPGSTHT